MPAGHRRTIDSTAPEGVVVIGNCQAEAVAAALGHPALRGRFAASYHFVGLPEADHAEARHQLASCSIVLVQDISNVADYPLRSAIPQRARIVKYPCLRLASPWPFDGQNGPDDREARSRPDSPSLFTHFDGLLGRLRGEIPDPEARFAAYRSLTVDRVINFARLHQFEERRLLALDREFDCSIGCFVLDRFRRERLFRSTGEPGAALYRMLMHLILRQLGCGVALPDDATLVPTEADEVPVHPLVAQSLRIAWAGEATTYLFRGMPVRWEEYVRHYIEHFG